MGFYYGYHNRPDLVADLTTRRQSGEKYMETVAHTLRGNVLWAVHRWVDVEGRVISTTDDRGGHFICAYLLQGAKKRVFEIGHWYEYANEGIVRISRTNPICGWIDGAEYRLTRKELIGECLTA